MIYKILSAILFVGVLVAGGFYFYEKYCHQKDLQEANNQVAELQGTIKEKENLYSAKAVEVGNLEAKNKELEKTIKSRNEQIAAIAEINLSLNDELIKIKNALQEVLDQNGNVVPIEPECEKCFLGKRFKVSFEQEQNCIKVSGFTLTSPPEAEVKVSWVKPLTLNVYLTRDDNKNFRIYLESQDNMFEKIDLSLKVDPSIFDITWYERFAFGGNLVAGQGIGSSLSIYYQFFGAWLIGPSFMGTYDGMKFEKMYGASVIWFPFK